jgi:hypothetical protein
MQYCVTTGEEDAEVREDAEAAGVGDATGP